VNLTRRRAGARPGDASMRPPSADPDAWPFVRAAAAHGLAGAPAVTTPPPTTDLGWTRVIRLAEQQRVVGLLAGLVADGGIEISPQQFEQLAETHEAWCAHDLRLERMLLRAADALDAAALPFLVIKGPALAHRWYGDPALRLFGDLDLVVPSGRVREASRVLAGVLGTSAPPELRPGFDERFGKETLLRSPPTQGSPGGIELDIHRTPVAGALGLAIPLDELFDGPGEVLVGGRALPTPGPVATLLVACYQATIADLPPRLIASRDVVQVATGSGAPTAADVIAAAGRWQGSALVAEAVSAAPVRLGLTGERVRSGALAEWALSYVPTPRERLLLAAHRGPGYVYWRQLAGVVVLSGSRPRADYLRALVSPQTSYLTERHWNRRGHARRGWRTLTGPLRHRVVAAARRASRRLRRLR
jgi:Uncharacterised nucleotidyltransferase